mmetsp:Transcript_25124/g.39443  ORF Transcript_25124/g.39443 Transcript_25124/m.39443 type:complete len:90 (+) Transcript_25124:1155-1424(+)
MGSKQLCTTSGSSQRIRTACWLGSGSAWMVGWAGTAGMDWCWHGGNDARDGRKVNVQYEGGEQVVNKKVNAHKGDAAPAQALLVVSKLG